MSSTDADARIAKMKDTSTHMAHKAENAVDLETGAVVAVTLGRIRVTTATVHDTEAGEAVADLMAWGRSRRRKRKPEVCVNGISQVVTDKGYHAGPVMAAEQSGVRTNGQLNDAFPTCEQTGAYPAEQCLELTAGCLDTHSSGHSGGSNRHSDGSQFVLEKIESGIEARLDSGNRAG